MVASTYPLLNPATLPSKDENPISFVLATTEQKQQQQNKGRQMYMGFNLLCSIL